MAHHSSDGFPPGLVESFERLGKTGKFPEGQYTNDDEGEIQFGVAADRANRKVIVDFGTPVAWMGMTPEQARELGLLLQQKAAEALDDTEPRP